MTFLSLRNDRKYKWVIITLNQILLFVNFFSIERLIIYERPSSVFKRMNLNITFNAMSSNNLSDM